MPIAAVPNYLGQDFEDASPGMRFGMYLKLWNMTNGSHRGLAFLKEKNGSALERVQSLTKAEDILAALSKRQQDAFATVQANQSLRLDAQSTAPFTTGLGNEHPLENGFAFLNPYGLPYLAGSGVKGVLRQAARELASGEWGEGQRWSGEKAIDITIDRKTVGISMIDALFGLESEDKEHVRGALTFWDVIPQIAGNHLAVDIMTPHQQHYYQQEEKKESGNSSSPHDSGQPVPICFLAVPPGSEFCFFVTCDIAFLARHAPELVESDHWKELVQIAFEHAFEWLGFGAKTSVGYGAMRIDHAAMQAQKQAIEKARGAALREQMSDAMCQIADYVDYMKTRHEALRGKPTRVGAEYQRTNDLSKAAQNATDWTAEERRAAADAITEWLPKVVQVDMKKERKKLKLAQIRGEP